MGRENLGDDRARDGQRGQARAAPPTFGLQPGVGECGQHDVALPSRQRAAFEVIEPEFVFEFLILLLDRPALMGKLHEGFQRAWSPAGRPGSTWCAACCPRSRSQSNQTSGATRRSRQSCAGVTRCATEAGAPRAIRAVAPGDEAPRLAGCAAAERALTATALDVGGQSVACAGGPCRRAVPAASRAGVPGKTVSVDDTPNAYGSFARCSVRRNVALSPNSASPDDGRHRDPAGAHLPQQRQRQAPFLLEARPSAECARAAAARASATPPADTSCAPSIQARAPVQSAAVTATWQLAILPSVPQYWRATPTECVPCLGKLVPSRISTPSRSGIVARSRRHTCSAAHGASVMKCWKAS